MRSSDRINEIQIICVINSTVHHVHAHAHVLDSTIGSPFIRQNSNYNRVLYECVRTHLAQVIVPINYTCFAYVQLVVAKFNGS